MSDYTVHHNLLKGTADGTWAYKTLSNSIDPAPAFGTAAVSVAMPSGIKNYRDIDGHTGIGITPRKGDSVTLGFWCKASAECKIHSFIYGDGTTIASALKHDENGTKTTDGNVVTNVSTDWTYVRHTWTYDADATKSPSFIVARLMNDVPAGTVVSIAGVMLVEGDTPAAWAPAEGETLAGGGALMSANLIAGVEPTLCRSASMPNPVSMENGVITSGVWKDVWYEIATWPVSLDAVTENQTVHIGLSVKWHDAAATTGRAWASVRYADAAGNTNTADAAIDGITTEWQRFSLSLVVPSGMRLTDCHISAQQLDAAYDATSPCMSYGSPVALASSAHTPYATEGHLQAKYASQEQLSSVSSNFTQTAQGFNASITTVTKALDDATGRISELKNLSDNMIGENGTFTEFYNSATSYMKFEYDENLKDSYLVLGQSDSTLSLRIGNDRIEFMDGPNVIAYVDGDKLFINNVQVVKRHMIADLEKNHGGFVFDTRDNGNMCVRWITG